VSAGEPEVTEVHNMVDGAAAGASPGSVETHRAMNAATNRRDLHEAVRHFRSDAEYTDHPRGLTTKGPAEYLEWLQDWINAFPDAKLEELTYIDGGDSSVAMFQARGTNSGPMGGLPATGNRLNLAFCEVLHYDAGGHVISGDIYYDAMSLMAQLGHIAPPAAS
jgi:steroid delta-isomerase-like uncharacterized protein